MMRRAFVLSCCFIVAVVAQGPSPAVNGRWYWRGESGWQRLQLDVKATGGKLSGVITLGPGITSDLGTAADWEYFFSPVSFPIENGKFDGATITFEQTVVRGAGTLPAEKLKYRGQFFGDRIQFVRESFQRANDAFVLGNHSFEFVAKRHNGIVEPLVIPAALAESNATFSRTSGSPTNVLLLFDHNQTWLAETPDASDPQSFGRDEWNALLLAAEHFLGQLKSTDRVAIAVFEDSVRLALDWHPIDEWQRQRQALTMGLSKPALGQKNLYGAIHWGVQKFRGVAGRQIAIIFTDGRDGRLSPRWLRSSGTGSAVALESPESVATRSVQPMKKAFSYQDQEILDPLFGLPDAGEAADFKRLWDAVAASGIELYFIVINAERDPEFGPALVGRRISGLFPGSSEAIDRYLARVRRSMELLASATHGRVLYGRSAKDAIHIYESLENTIATARGQP